MILLAVEPFAKASGEAAIWDESIEKKGDATVEIAGVHAFPRKSVVDRIHASIKGKNISELLLEQVKYRIASFYQENGFIHARVEASVLNSHLSVRIHEGNQVVVDQILLTGMRQVSEQEVREEVWRSLASIEQSQGLFRPIDHGDIDDLMVGRQFGAHDHEEVFLSDGSISLQAQLMPLNQRAFEDVAPALQDFYHNLGYLHAEVSPPRISFSDDGLFARVVYAISEGRRVLIARVEGLPEQGDIAIGAPVDLRKFEELRHQAEQKLWNEGYPFARVKVEMKEHEDTARADIFFETTAGPLVHVDEIVISGNVKTRTKIIMQRLALSQGDIVSVNKMAESRARLLETDLFSRVDVSLDEEAVRGNIGRLLIHVEERKPATIELGFGASLEDGPRLIAAFDYRNLFGLALALRTRLQINYPALFYQIPFFYPQNTAQFLENKFADEPPALRALLFFEGKGLVSLEYPDIFGSYKKNSGKIDFAVQRDIRPAFNLNKFSTQMSFGFSPRTWVKLTPSAEVEYANFDCDPTQIIDGSTCFDQSNILTRRLDSGVVKQVTLQFLSSFDSRGDNVGAGNKTAVFGSLSADLGVGTADLVGNANHSVPINYAKVVASINGLLPFAKDTAFVFNLRAGNIFSLADGNYVPLFKRFYLGGTNSIRGFSEDEILPADDTGWPGYRTYPFNLEQASNYPPSLGGNFVANLRSEVRFFITKNLAAATFVDVGELLIDPGHFSFETMAMGSGFGIRYQTPIGALMLDLGIRLFDGNRRTFFSLSDRLGLHFSIGQT